MLYAARVGTKEDRTQTSTGKWITLEELALNPPNGIGIPRSTLNYLMWFEGKGLVVRKRMDASGEERAEAHESVMDRIATKYGIKYRIRRMHIYPSGIDKDGHWVGERVPCEKDHPTDEWEIAAAFIDPPQDAEWDRWVQRNIQGEIADQDGSADQGHDGEET